MLTVEVRVTSVYTIDTVRATVGSKSVLLKLVFPEGLYTGVIDLRGEAEGVRQVSFYASNLNGEKMTLNRNFTYINPPRIIIDYPRSGQTFQGKIRVKATVTQYNNNSVGAYIGTLNATTTPILFRNSIDTLIDMLPNLQSASFFVTITPAEGFGIVQPKTVAVFLDRSPYLQKVFSAAGTISKFRDTRALMTYKNDGLTRYTIVSTIDTSTSYIDFGPRFTTNGNSFPVLCEGGAAFLVNYDLGASDNYELLLWKNDSLYTISEDLGFHAGLKTRQLNTSLQTAGNVLVWYSASGVLCITNLTTLQTTYPGIAPASFSVSRQGKIAYTTAGNLFTYDIATGVKTQLTSTGKSTLPVIDGNQVVYGEDNNTNNDSLYYYDGAAIQPLKASSGGAYDVYDSCVVFTRYNSSGVYKMFLRTPIDTALPVFPILGGSTAPGVLGDNGAGLGKVTVSGVPAYYYFDTAHLSGPRLSSGFGTAYYQDSTYYYALGNTLFRYNLPMVNFPPKIVSVSPDTAAAGEHVTVKGRFFNGVTAVKLGNVAAGSYTVVNDTVINAVVGSGASGDVVVVTSGGTDTLKNAFVFAERPELIALSPATAGQGTAVLLKGRHLNGATAVSFGGVAAGSFTVLSDTSISALVGNGASGDVVVVTPGGRDTLGGFVFIIPAQITGLSSNSGLGGATITISGIGFTGATAVSFGGVAAASFTVVNDSTINAIIGSGASGDVTVVAPAGTAVYSGFTYQFGLPGNNFSLKNTNITCRNVQDGNIAITAAQALNYSAVISRTGWDSTFTFTTGATVSHLAAGTYELCVTVAGQAGYEQCFTSVLTQPEDLSVFVAVAQQQVVLNLGGSGMYNVSLNDSVFSTTSSTLTLPVRNGRNILSVSTDKYCQGIVYKEFVVNGGVSVYPNPFVGSFIVNLGAKVLKQVLVQVFDGNGRLVLSKVYRNQSGLLGIDLPGAAPGLYVVKVNEDSFKILKQ
jgi:hypothetical protein